jgi:hypothetical protein
MENRRRLLEFMGVEASINAPVVSIGFGQAL